MAESTDLIKTRSTVNSMPMFTENIDEMEEEELKKLLELTEYWSSSQDFKFYLYQPNPTLIPFHSSIAKCRALFGGNRSGKTYGGAVDAAAQFLGKAPKSISIDFPSYRLDQTRRIRFNMGDYPNSFTKVIWPTIQQLIPPDEIAEVAKDSGRIKAIVNRKGGFIEFMQYDQDVSKFQGSSRHAMFYDEEPPESIRDENLMRLVDTDGEEVFLLTPVSGALKWLYDTIYLKAGRVVEKFDDIITDKALPGGDTDVHVFFASIFDNQAVARGAAERILSKFPSEERIVREKGHFLFLSGLVYKEYSDPIHLIKPFDWTNGNYTLYVAIDPHPRTPHAVLFVVVDKEGTMFVVDELFMDCTAPELVEAIQVKCDGVTPEIIIIDPLAYAPDPATKTCLAFSLMDAGLVDPMPRAASKDKSHGIITLRKRLKDKKFFVTNNCTRFRHEITHYAWDDWRKDTQNVKGQKQKPIDKDDHMMENWYRIELLNPQFISAEERYDEEREEETNYNEQPAYAPGN